MLLFCAIQPNAISAQKIPLQTITGSVLDQSLKTPLGGATVELTGQNRSVLTREDGSFKLLLIPVGRISLTITFSGYKSVVFSNLLVESGKETNLVVEMEAQVIINKEIQIQSTSNKDKPVNEFTFLSGREISMDEMKRFAAGLNDPSRTATAFAGVTSSGDGNSLIIRGNAPNGLLWRMEGVDIPNPNHFSRAGTSGGGISILSAQLLSNADFIISAFPAEYGNALAGVFDIRLREGNKDRQEHTFSVSTIGIDMATEGYFKKGYGGSYLVNYRYGFLTLLQKLGFKIGDAPTTFQDLSFNIHLPSKKWGDFSVFGFGGLSNQQSIAQNDSLSWTNDPSKRSGWLDGSNTMAVGLTHQVMLSGKTLLRTVVSVNANNYRQDDNRYDHFNGPLITSRNNQFREVDNILSLTFTHKFNSKFILKSGIVTTGKAFNLQQNESVNNILRDKISSNGSTRLSSIFSECKWSPFNPLKFTFGVYGQYFSLNKSMVAEPRAGVRLLIKKNQYFTLGFGLHSQIQPLGNYFARIKIGSDSVQPNLNLGPSKATHYVTGYEIQLTSNWSLKTEIYYQWLHNIPVNATGPTSFSMLNVDENYTIQALNNNGKGKNYGVEVTLRRWWNDQFYMLSTLSVYQSTYLASDNIWRSTLYNANTDVTFLAGKEWTMKSRKPSSLNIDLKIVYNGGVRVTPIEIPQSIVQHTTVLDNTRIFGEKLSPYFRVDLQAEWKFQRIKKTGSLIIGVQNLTDRKNPVSQSYNTTLKQVQYDYLLRIIPVIGYKVDFQ